MATLSQIALTFIPRLGPTAIRRLMEAYPGEDIFSLPRQELKAAFGSHIGIIESISSKSGHARAEQELAFCEKNGIRPLFFTDSDFPERLNRPECGDSPVLLYVMGRTDLNAERTVSGGATTPTAWCATSRHTTHRLSAAWPTESTPPPTPLPSTTACPPWQCWATAWTASIRPRTAPWPSASSMPAALSLPNIPTTPPSIPNTSQPDTAIHPKYFPARNRIIAAMGDATVVVEASEKGGALITAAIAASYQRDVFALPGRLTDTYSRGCNNLIATNRAQLLRTADDIAFQLGWPLIGKQMAIAEAEEAAALSPTEQKVIDLLQEYDRMTLDEVAARLAASLPKAAGLMFNLEMRGLVHTLPGHLYQASR